MKSGANGIGEIMVRVATEREMNSTRGGHSTSGPLQQVQQSGSRKRVVMRNHNMRSVRDGGDTQSLTAT